MTLPRNTIWSRVGCGDIPKISLCDGVTQTTNIQRCNCLVIRGVQTRHCRSSFEKLVGNRIINTIVTIFNVLIRKRIVWIRRFLMSKGSETTVYDIHCWSLSFTLKVITQKSGSFPKQSRLLRYIKILNGGQILQILEMKLHHYSNFLSCLNDLKVLGQHLFKSITTFRVLPTQHFLKRLPHPLLHEHCFHFAVELVRHLPLKSKG